MVVVCFTLFWMVYGVTIWVGFDYMFLGFDFYCLLFVLRVLFGVLFICFVLFCLGWVAGCCLDWIGLLFDG